MFLRLLSVSFVVGFIKLDELPNIKTIARGYPTYFIARNENMKHYREFKGVAKARKRPCRRSGSQPKYLTLLLIPHTICWRVAFLLPVQYCQLGQEHFGDHHWKVRSDLASQYGVFSAAFQSLGKLDFRYSSIRTGLLQVAYLSHQRSRCNTPHNYCALSCDDSIR